MNVGAMDEFHATIKCHPARFQSRENRFFDAEFYGTKNAKYSSLLILARKDANPLQQREPFTMSNTIHAAQLLHTMAPSAKMAAGSQPAPNAPSTQKAAGLFDHFLTQAEKDFIANQLQQMKWIR